MVLRWLWELESGVRLELRAPFLGKSTLSVDGQAIGRGPRRGNHTFALPEHVASNASLAFSRLLRHDSEARLTSDGAVILPARAPRYHPTRLAACPDCGGLPRARDRFCCVCGHELPTYAQLELHGVVRRAIVRLAYFAATNMVLFAAVLVLLSMTHVFDDTYNVLLVVVGGSASVHTALWVWSKGAPLAALNVALCVQASLLAAQAAGIVRGLSTTGTDLTNLGWVVLHLKVISQGVEAAARLARVEGEDSLPVAPCPGQSCTWRLGAKFCVRCGLSSDRDGRAQPPSVRSSPKGAWPILHPVNVLFGCLLAICLIGTLFEQHGLPLGVVGRVAMGLPVVLFAIADWESLQPLWRWRSLPLHDGAALGALLLVSLILLDQGIGFLQELAPTTVLANAGLTDRCADTWMAYVWSAGYAVVLEEVAFRGVLLTRLTKFLPTNQAVVLQGAMFAALHLVVAQSETPVVALVITVGTLFTHTALGILLGVLRLETRSLYASMLVHACWNVWRLYESHAPLC